MRIEPAVRQPGVVHDRVHPDGIYAMAAKQRARGREDSLSRLRLALTRHPHVRHPCNA
jgi:hypothetical protein